MTAAAWIVQERPNPSTDFFIRPWLARAGIDGSPQPLDANPPSPPDGVRVVFVRYLTPQWRRWVQRHRHRIRELAWFIDDDVFSLQAASGMPWRYRWKLWRLAGRHIRWLDAEGARGLTSSHWLARTYGSRFASGLEVLPMASPYALGPQPDPASKRIFYHGSASHQAEHRWLRPVIKSVLAARPEASFEVIADRRVARAYRGIDRVECIPPMDWLAYRHLITQPGRAIGLAPLLDTPFNAARAPTKVLDITAAGAVGVYARHPVFEPAVRDEVNGRLCPMEQAAWVRAIIQLLDQPDARVRLWQGARG